jgi:hypothetical protein
VGSYINATASGHGGALLSGGTMVPPLGIYAELVTPGFYTRIDGNSPVRRVHQAGFVGVGQHDGNTSGGFSLTYGKFIEAEFGYLFVAPVFGYLPYVDAIEWDLGPGVMAYLEVDW